MDSCDINVEPNRGMQQLRMKLDEMIQSSKETLYSIDEVIKVKTNQISMDFMFIFSGANSVPWFTFDPSLADSATGLSPATLPTKGLGFF